MPLEECPVDVRDLATLGAMFEEHRPKLLAMVERRSAPGLAARRDPEEILSDAYLKAQDRWPAFQEAGMTPYAWLYQIVLNCLLDDHDFHGRQKRDYRRDRALPDRSSLQLLEGLVSPRTGPSDAVARKEEQERLRDYIARTMELLKPDDRDILHMVFFDLLTTAEIAMIKGLREGTVRQRYSRAKLRFIDLWIKVYGTEGLDR
jgi:RNA polymerase sigma factor (sigma-70 family)